MGMGLRDIRYQSPYTCITFCFSAPSCPCSLLEYRYGPSSGLHSLLWQSHQFPHQATIPGVGRSITNALSLIIPARAGLPYMSHTMARTKWCYLHIMAHCNKQKGFPAAPVTYLPYLAEGEGAGMNDQIHLWWLGNSALQWPLTSLMWRERVQWSHPKTHDGKRVYEIRIKTRPMSIRFRESVT